MNRSEYYANQTLSASRTLPPIVPAFRPSTATLADHYRMKDAAAMARAARAGMGAN